MIRSGYVFGRAFQYFKKDLVYVMHKRSKACQLYKEKSNVLISKILYKQTTRSDAKNHSHERTYQNSALPKPMMSIYVAGILGFLGLEKEEVEDELILTIKRGVLAMQEGNFNKAEQMLHLALKMAQDKQNQDGITYVYDLLANIAYQQGDLVKAEKLFVSLLQRLLGKGTSKDDNSVIHVSLKLASMYALMDKKDKAEEGFRYCIDALQKKMDSGVSDDDTLLLWAMSVDWYARYLVNIGKYTLAQSYFQKAYDMSAKVNGPEHDQSLVLLNDLGSVCSLRGDLDGALVHLNKAIEIGKKSGTEDLASFYVNVGTVYMQKKMFKNAKEACQEGWWLAKRKKNAETQEEASQCLHELKAHS